MLGKAIIASDCTGNREQITDKVNGELIQISPENIADSIERLLKNPDKIKEYENASLAVNLAHSEDLKEFLSYMAPPKNNNLKGD